eukprot:1596400-Alexandrium_andersonii.AAC.1
MDWRGGVGIASDMTCCVLQQLRGRASIGAWRVLGRSSVRRGSDAPAGAASRMQRASTPCNSKRARASTTKPPRKTRCMKRATPAAKGFRAAAMHA